MWWDINQSLDVHNTNTGHVYSYVVKLMKIPPNDDDSRIMIWILQNKRSAYALVTFSMHLIGQNEGILAGFGE